MGRIKNKLVTICVIVPTILFMICYGLLWYQAEHMRFYIRDISGDRSDLKDIMVKGLVRDDLYKTDFLIKDDKVRYDIKDSKMDDQFQYYLEDQGYYSCLEEFEPSEDAHIMGGKPFVSGDSVLEGQQVKNIKVDKADIIYNITQQDGPLSALVHTEMKLNSDNYGIGVTYNKESGKAVISGRQLEGVDIGDEINNQDAIIRTNKGTGRIYAYTLTGSDVSGTGGAYDITDCRSETWYPLRSPEKLKLIAPIPLENGKVHIVGMETTGNMLLFIIVKEEDIILKPFDLSQNQFLEEIPLQYDSQNYSIFGYDYRGDTNGEYISLMFPLSQKKEQENYIMKSVVYNAKSNRIEMQSDQKGLEGNTRAETMKYKNHKLYVVQRRNTFQNVKYDNDGFGSESQLIVTVLDESGIKYQGEIYTGESEDVLFQGSPDYHDLKGLEWRNLYRLSLE